MIADSEHNGGAGGAPIHLLPDALPDAPYWVQMLERDCLELDGKWIEFSLTTRGGYIEGQGWMRVTRHPRHAVLCGISIEVKPAPPAQPWLLRLPADAVAQIRPQRWNPERFLLECGSG